MIQTGAVGPVRDEPSPEVTTNARERAVDEHAADGEGADAESHEPARHRREGEARDVIVPFEAEHGERYPLPRRVRSGRIRERT